MKEKKGQKKKKERKKEKLSIILWSEIFFFHESFQLDMIASMMGKSFLISLISMHLISGVGSEIRNIST